MKELEQNVDDTEELAHYLNQIVFCLYAEDAGLLPDGLFTRIVKQHYHNPGQLRFKATRDLFRADGRLEGFSGLMKLPISTVIYSNPFTRLSSVSNALEYLEQATRKDWRNIEPSIFGTLFERALDASKRSQLGAHYTSAADIELVVEPVVMDPLRREWETVRQEVNALADNGNQAVCPRPSRGLPGPFGIRKGARPRLWQRQFPLCGSPLTPGPGKEGH